MTKLLFLTPMHITFESFKNPANNVRCIQKQDGRSYNLPPTDLPLGFLSLSAYLKKSLDVEIRLLDFNVEVVKAQAFPFETFHDYVADQLKDLDFDPDIIGVSCLFSPSYQNFLDTGAAVRAVYPDKLIIGGGNVPTSAYQEVYSEARGQAFDALCYGEGEVPLHDLVVAEDRKRYLSNSPNWITYKNATSPLPFTPSHNFIEDLDEIPFFDYDLCDIDAHNANLVISSFASEKAKRSFHVMTSRGCPFKCTFCASHAVHGRDMRYHSLERIEADFRILKEKYGGDTMIFQDDHLMSDKTRVKAILDILKRLELKSVYQSGLALYALDRDMLEHFYAAGVRQLVLAVESGSQRVLKQLMKKPLKFKVTQQVAKDCRELGIYTNANILIGMPGETKADMDEARETLRELGSNWFHINCASPLIGSEMHEVSREKGYIRGETLGADYKVAAVETEDFSIPFIQEMQYLMNLELNFVHNADVKLGEYKMALAGFDNVIRIKPDHAFAWYYGALCHKGMDDRESCAAYMEKFRQYAKDPLWARYCVDFGLDPEATEPMPPPENYVLPEPAIAPTEQAVA
ncbi:B12-binding domain-containing radical SAM protein [Magnetofaba australis]|nr:radical SAM protein [Magnetofaba australis]